MSCVSLSQRVGRAERIRRYEIGKVDRPPCSGFTTWKLVVASMVRDRQIDGRLRLKTGRYRADLWTGQQLPEEGASVLREEGPNPRVGLEITRRVRRCRWLGHHDRCSYKQCRQYCA